MNCREFRAQHCAFVDDTLSVADMAAMRGHLEVCVVCARLDTRVRRSLLLVRNSPRLECSPDFAARLHERIREIGPVDRLDRSTRGLLAAGVRYAAFAAGLAAAAAVGAVAVDRFDRGIPEIRMAPVIAAAPELDPIPSTVTSPAYVASVVSGMPIWPAVVVAGQSSVHMANYEFQLAGYSER